MNKSINIRLPEEVAKTLEDFARAQHLSIDDVVSRAVREYIFRKRFRRLRERTTVEAQRRGIVTDEDVFNRVS